MLSSLLESDFPAIFRAVLRGALAEEDGDSNRSCEAESSLLVGFLRLCECAPRGSVYLKMVCEYRCTRSYTAHDSYTLG